MLNRKEELNNLYYNPEQVIRSGKFINFILSTRSKGKTFAFSRYCIKKFIEDGSQFIYMRRFVDECDLGCSTFFDEVSEKFPGHTFKLGSFEVNEAKKERGQKIGLKITTFLIDGKVAGYGVPLQRVGKVKSVKFTNVKTLFFDEFLPDTNQFLGGIQNSLKDPFLFFSFVSTVARGGGEVFRSDLRCFLTANTISIANPYFIYCNLTHLIRPESKLIKTDDGYLIQIIKDKGIMNEVLKSEAGRAIARTAYFNYAYKGEFSDDSRNLIGKPASMGWYVMTVIVDGKVYGIRECPDDGVIYISKNSEDSCNRIYTLTKKDHSVNTIMLQRFGADPDTKRIKKEYQNGNCLFDSFETKIAFETIMMM